MKVANISITPSTMNKKKFYNVSRLSKLLFVAKGQPGNLKKGEMGRSPDIPMQLSGTPLLYPLILAYTKFSETNPHKYRSIGRCFFPSTHPPLSGR